MQWLSKGRRTEANGSTHQAEANDVWLGYHLAEPRRWVSLVVIPNVNATRRKSVEGVY